MLKMSPLLVFLLTSCQPEELVPAHTTRADPHGLTWWRLSHNTELGVDHISCHGDEAYGSCDPYSGDLPCSASAPVLCIRYTDAPNPGIDDDFYHGWAAGEIAVTEPIPGEELTSLAAADALCEGAHGEGWQMAEFHDGGGGWSWYAFGDIGLTDRLWVYIDDQPANCWN